MRVTFDAHIPDRFLDWPEAQQKRRLVEAFRQRRYTFYPTLEFLEEVLCMSQTARAARLAPHAHFILEVFNGRILNYWGHIVSGELGTTGSVFAPALVARRTLETLAQLAAGRDPGGLAELAARSRQKKADDVRAYRAHQSRIMADLDGLLARELAPGRLATRAELRRVLSTISYPEYHERYMERHGLSVMARIGRQVGITDPARHRRLLEMLAHYPHTEALVRINSLLLHTYMAQQRRVKTGDIYDGHQLICANGLDLFVTDDRALQAKCAIIYPAKRVLGFADFMQGAGTAA